jgi:hypothetical protein
MSSASLSELQWESLLTDGGARRSAPPEGSRCDAWRYGCAERATHVVVGVHVALCLGHLTELEAAADALGLRIYPFAPLLAVAYAAGRGALAGLRHRARWDEGT